MNWSDNIKKLRENLLLTQKEFAELLNVAYVSINRWENGHNEPTMKVKRKLKELFIKHNIKE